MSLTHNERLERGLCGNCGSRPLQKGTYCLRCHENRRRSRLAAAELRRKMQPKIDPRPWSPAETQRAMDLRRLGKDWIEIGLAMGRSEWSVKNHVNKQTANQMDPAPVGKRKWCRLVPYPGVERCKCGLALPCNSCLAKNVTEHVEKYMRRPSP